MEDYIVIDEAVDMSSDDWIRITHKLDFASGANQALYQVVNLTPEVELCPFCGAYWDCGCSRGDE